MAALLLLGAETPSVARILPVLLRSDFELCEVARADEALPLIRQTPFALILVRYPLAGLELAELIAAVRHESSPCRECGLVLLADPSAVSDVGRFLGRGVSRIVSLDAPSDRLLHAVADLLSVAPRREVRALVQLRLSVRSSGMHVLAMSQNLSILGMLVRGGRELPVGVQVHFELTLPDGGGTVSGTGEVVRHSDSAREKCEGIGVRFESLDGDGELRLARYLKQSGKAAPR